MIIKTENLKRLFQVGSETVEALKGINLSVIRVNFYQSWDLLVQVRHFNEYYWLFGYSIFWSLLFE